METNKWYTSKETKSLLKISDCKLMHLRIEGKIEFSKEGRIFFYIIKYISNLFFYLPIYNQILFYS